MGLAAWRSSHSRRAASGVKPVSTSDASGRSAFAAWVTAAFTSSGVFALQLDEEHRLSLLAHQLEKRLVEQLYR